MPGKNITEEFWVVAPPGTALRDSLIIMAQQSQLEMQILEEDGHLNQNKLMFIVSKLRFSVSGAKDCIGNFREVLSQYPDIKFVGLEV